MNRIFKTFNGSSIISTKCTKFDWAVSSGEISEVTEDVESIFTRIYKKLDEQYQFY